MLSIDQARTSSLVWGKCVVKGDYVEGSRSLDLEELLCPSTKGIWIPVFVIPYSCNIDGSYGISASMLLWA